MTEFEDYFPLPEKCDRKKFITLLGKRPNKNIQVKDVLNEVKKFLNDNEVSYSENTLEQSPNFHSIELGKVFLFVVDDYSKFNTHVLPKKYVEDMHFKWTKQGYRVIWIKKFEWEDPRKQNVLQSLILHACGKTKNRIFARKTVAEIIPSVQLRKFFDASSFYGYRNATFAVCLKDKTTGEVLMAMSFGHPYYGKGKYGDRAVECIRAATKPHTIVVGGMTKLMKFLLDSFPDEFDTINFYVDSGHYSCGSMSAIGFEYSHFAGGSSHNLWVETGSMFMRTPALHQEIKYLNSRGEILAIPDVGNDTFLLYRNKAVIQNASSTDI
jgi:hypothetical protein